MQTLMLPAGDPESITQALSILQAGGLVAFPTDTVYGVGALAFDGTAVESIYAAKDRPVEKAIPVLLAGVEELEKVAAKVPPMARRLAILLWPGPLTLVVPKTASLPEAVSGSSSVAVRVPDHPAALALLGKAGPMAVTSANRSGEPSPASASDVMRQLGGRIPLILDGGSTPGGIPSTLLDCMGNKPVILREGPIGLSQILEALKGI
jgi:L-threonylcarbamoyladenylate synthase